MGASYPIILGGSTQILHTPIVSHPNADLGVPSAVRSKHECILAVATERYSVAPVQWSPYRRRAMRTVQRYGETYNQAFRFARVWGGAPPAPDASRSLSMTF